MKKPEIVREVIGVGLRGAKFTNLKFKINLDSLSTDFVYISKKSLPVLKGLFL